MTARRTRRIARHAPWPRATGARGVSMTTHDGVCAWRVLFLEPPPRPRLLNRSTLCSLRLCAPLSLLLAPFLLCLSRAFSSLPLSRLFFSASLAPFLLCLSRAFCSLPLSRLLFSASLAASFLCLSRGFFSLPLSRLLFSLLFSSLFSSLLFSPSFSFSSLSFAQGPQHARRSVSASALSTSVSQELWPRIPSRKRALEASISLRSP